MDAMDTVKKTKAKSAFKEIETIIGQEMYKQSHASG